MKITRFEDLECLQEARKLVRLVYDATNDGPSIYFCFELSAPYAFSLEL
jgi:hypothetical protein